MREVLNDLLTDVGEQHKLSMAGDKAFLSSLSDIKLLTVLEEGLTQLLLSVEGRNKVFQPLEILNARENGSFKNLFNGMFRLIFDEAGRELAYPDAGAYAGLYQVFSLLTKYGAGDVTPGMVSDARSSYLRIEDDMTTPSIDSSVLHLAQQLIAEVLRGGEDRIFAGRHGPGSVAEGRLDPGQKYGWTEPIGFDHSLFDCLSQYQVLRQALGVEQLCNGSLSDPRASRWCTVPKTWRKCRAICAEPALLQYLQQSLGRQIAYACQVSPFCGADVRRQDVNANLARESSLHGYYCTIDLSSASDRLSMHMVERLFPKEWFAKLAGCRSERTVLPDGHVLELKKYGSMGNATTFPVQSLVYWALLVSLMRSDGIAMHEARSNVFAYGDDIILPTRYAGPASSLLEGVGLRVNTSKSFSKGSFRESCGMHAYHGVDVTPAYLRTTSLTGPGLVSMCACANLLKKNGYNHASTRLFRIIEARLGARLPTVGSYFVSEGNLRNVQLSIIDEHATLSDLVHMNESKGIRVRRSGCQYCVVKAYGLYELRTKRRGNVFANTADMWDFTRGICAVSDRGYIPGDVALSQRYIRLL